MRGLGTTHEKPASMGGLHCRPVPVTRNSGVAATRFPRQVERQRPHVRAECFRDLAEREERQIAFPALHAADVAAINIAFACEILLRPAAFLPRRTDAVAEDAERSQGLHSARRLKICRLSVHGLSYPFWDCGFGSTCTVCDVRWLLRLVTIVTAFIIKKT